jgi:hypothetical protein
MQILSGEMGKMLRGMEQSAFFTPELLAPGACWGSRCSKAGLRPEPLMPPLLLPPLALALAVPLAVALLVAVPVPVAVAVAVAVVVPVALLVALPSICSKSFSPRALGYEL